MMGFAWSSRLFGGSLRRSAAPGLHNSLDVLQLGDSELRDVNGSREAPRAACPIDTSFSVCFFFFRF